MVRQDFPQEVTPKWTAKERERPDMQRSRGRGFWTERLRWNWAACDWNRIVKGNSHMGWSTETDEKRTRRPEPCKPEQRAWISTRYCALRCLSSAVTYLINVFKSPSRCCGVDCEGAKGKQGGQCCGVCNTQVRGGAGLGQGRKQWREVTISEYILQVTFDGHGWGFGWVSQGGERNQG